MSSTDSEGQSEPTNILYLCPSSNGSGSESCIELLSVDSPPNTLALLTTYTNQQSPEKWLRSWEEYAGDRPARTKVISIGDFTRSAAQPSRESGASLGDSLPIETVGDPSDLTGLGIVISEFLGQWNSEKWEDGPTQLVFCFDSLTVLLQYVELKRAFRFLHVLIGRLKTVDAVAHFHLDASAHDQQTIATLRSLFDTVVKVEDDGDLTTDLR